MTNWQDVYPQGGNLLNTKIARELKLFNKKLKIVSVDIEQIRDKDKIVLTFEGLDKRYAINKTNAGIIADAFGDDTVNWNGEEIQLIEIRTTYQGETVPALQVVPIESQKG